MQVESSFVEGIKMAAGFSGVRQYDERLIFMFKVASKIRFSVSLRGGMGLSKTSQGRFPLQN